MAKAKRSQQTGKSVLEKRRVKQARRQALSRQRARDQATVRAS